MVTQLAQVAQAAQASDDLGDAVLTIVGVLTSAFLLLFLLAWLEPRPSKAKEISRRLSGR
jgi:hypothetical protein